MRPRYIMLEEVWSSASSKASGRRLSEQPLFSGGGLLIAYAYAKHRASEFDYHGVYDEGDQLYWWGRNEGDRTNRRFVIKPAPSSPPLLVDKDGRSRGRRSQYTRPTSPTVEAPGPADIA
jgi:hypothetical protein